MFEVDEPTFVHEIAYKSSGATAPRNLSVQIHIVRYRSDFKYKPTFLVTADLQGRENGIKNRLVGELLAEEIAVLQELDALPEFDLCLLCGDFYDYPDLKKLGGTGDVTSVLNALSRVADQTIAVLGNHDEVIDKDLNANITVLDGEVITTRTFTIGGVSGIIGSANRINRKSESEFLEAVDKCSTSRTNLLLLHQGPEGATVDARGLGLINAKLRRRSNLLVLFGHCHWKIPFQTEGKNLYCNVDGRVFAFIPDTRK